jgi:deoxyhypusine synthase
MLQIFLPSRMRLQHVLVHSEPVPEGTPEVQGHDFEHGRDLDAIMGRMATSGFQATNLGQAVDLVNEMVRPSFELCRREL